MRLLFWTIMCLATVALVTAGRRKRTVAFPKGSKFFFRMNFKENVIPATTIFAHASGFKVTWDLPEGSRIPNRRPIRDVHFDIHENAEYMYTSHGLDGKSCLLKNICDAAEYVGGRSGVVTKILKLFIGTSLGGNETRIPEPDDCDFYRRLCPLDFSDVSTIS